jgi:hypothetical protein
MFIDTSILCLLWFFTGTNHSHTILFYCRIFFKLILMYTFKNGFTVNGFWWPTIHNIHILRNIIETRHAHYIIYLRFYYLFLLNVNSWGIIHQVVNASTLTWFIKCLSQSPSCIFNLGRLWVSCLASGVYLYTIFSSRKNIGCLDMSTITLFTSCVNWVPWHKLTIKRSILYHHHKQGNKWKHLCILKIYTII